MHEIRLLIADSPGINPPCAGPTGTSVTPLARSNTSSFRAIAIIGSIIDKIHYKYCQNIIDADKNLFCFIEFPHLKYACKSVKKKVL